VLLNLLVREFPGFVGKQSAQVSSDQESGNGGTVWCLSYQQAFICRLSDCIWVTAEGHWIWFALGQSVRPLPPTELTSFALDMQWGLPSLPILGNTTLSDSVSCPDSSVQSSRLVGRHFEGVQTGISDGGRCAGSLQGLVRGLKASKPLSRLLGPDKMTAKWDMFAASLWRWGSLLRSSFPCLLHRS